MNIPIKRQMLVLPEYLIGKSSIKVAFFDADSTLRVSKPGRPSPASSPEDVVLLPDIVDKLKELVNKNYLLIIVSNQAGISLGYVSLKAADETMRATVKMISELGVNFNYYDFADQYDENRKPKIGMALRLENILQERGLNIDWQNSFMVGDAAWKRGKDLEPSGKPGSDHSNSDRLFAENIMKIHNSFKFYHPRDFFGWQKKYGVTGFPNGKELSKLKSHR